MKTFGYTKKMDLRRLVAAGSLWLCLAGSSGAAESISGERLAERLVSDEPPLLLDIRREHQYEAGHIPGAINIPLGMLGSRRLPPVGEVIIYADGLGETDPLEAVALLEKREGLEPKWLRGGYAGWETVSGVSTAMPGFQKSSQRHISYGKLKASGGNGAVIYDLRKKAGSALEEHFPDARVVRGDRRRVLRAASDSGAARPQSLDADEGQANPLLRGKRASSEQLIVLIDDDNESAREVAASLRAQGLHRVVILAGGEMMVEMEGRSGLERASSGSFLWEPGEGEEADSQTEDRP